MRNVNLRNSALVPGNPSLKYTDPFAHLTLHVPHFTPQRRDFIIPRCRLGKARQTDNRHDRRQKK